MLADLWPTFGLELTTPRLTLRLPSEDELVALARVAGEGVHGPDERPFLTPWTEGTADERERAVLSGHWYRLSAWETDDWSLGMAILDRSGTAMGIGTLRARDFRVNREVTTSSWLGLRFHGQGYGTEARTALLTLAFDHLGATDATSEVFQDNHASQGVSRKLGYLHDGISRDRRGEEVLVSDRLRLTSTRWAQVSSRVDVRVAGLERARPMFT
ncbi:GNAT family N-acetyltransferase [Intrasporangium sp. YIM S08009]|uniref:GNAT family N-acetyltransferase n=1 Tax=Intrasporangium zincisolvens TaxID=3080018 RepID=UPI002B0566C2|nr:GNAT family N-acetyltransferase [Intrasporangium sp. YIM S08009]